MMCMSMCAYAHISVYMICAHLFMAIACRHQVGSIAGCVRDDEF